MTDYFRIGVITKPHGLKGEMRVFPVTEDAHRFRDLKSVFVERNAVKAEMKVKSARMQKNMVLLALEGVDTVEEAQTYTNAVLFVDRAHAIPLNEGEYYVPDLIGMEVVTEDGVSVGKLTEVLETGANDVYVVKGETEHLIPAVKEFVKAVDPEAGIMTVHLIEGM